MTLICYANSSSSTARAQHKYTVTVVNAHKTLDMPDTIIPFDMLRTFVLNCSIPTNYTNDLKIQWFKNNQEITDIIYFRSGKVQLHIFNATEWNEGTYKCAIEIKNAVAGKIILYQTFKMAFKPYWSKWSPWSQCQPKCGMNSIKRRVRNCHRSKILQPYTKWRCPGGNVQRKRCKTIACSRNGAWTEWSEWSG